MPEDRTDELREAADRLGDARERADAGDDTDAAERLAKYADQLRTMADADRGPDHGRLDRLQHNLREVADGLDREGTEAVEAALSHVVSYRETVEGV